MKDIGNRSLIGAHLKIKKKIRRPSKDNQQLEEQYVDLEALSGIEHGDRERERKGERSTQMYLDLIAP